MDIQTFLRFLDSCRTGLAAARLVEASFLDAGFVSLDLRQPWPVKGAAGGSRSAYCLRSGGSVIAFRPGSAPPTRSGLIMIGAHTDSPGLQLKPASAAIVDGQLVVPVEVYGGPISATWLDRELALSGKVAYKDSAGIIRSAVLDTPGPVALIPNVAIHLNRDLKDKTEYNPQNHLKAVFGPVASNPTAAGPTTAGSTPADALLALLKPYLGSAGNAAGNAAAASACSEARSLVDAELFLVPYQKAQAWGPGDAMVSSPRIDNLAGTFTIAEALRDSPGAEATQVALLLDHEEIGSTSLFGAAGGLAETVLRRLVHLLEGDSSPDAFQRAMARSVLISNDAAHGRHPNYQDKHDSGYAPLLGGGPVIKKSAVRRYATELETVAWLSAVAQTAGLPLQFFQSRSDIPAGSTIGPILSSRLGVVGLDLGIPIWAMHSSRECACFSDVLAMRQLLMAAYAAPPDVVSL